MFMGPVPEGLWLKTAAVTYRTCWKKEMLDGLDGWSENCLLEDDIFSLWNL